MSSEIAKNLSQKISSPVIQNEPLSKYTTLRVGGPAKVYVVADSLHDLRTCIKVAVKNDISYLVIGKGSNILVSDSGYDGLVIRLGKEFSRLKIENNHIFAGSAVPLAKVLSEAYRKGLSGLSFAIGIPGSVGGAVMMNAGAHGSHLSQVLQKVTTLSKDLSLKSYEKDDFKAYYRRSLAPKEEIVLEAVFGLKLANRASIKGHMERNFKQRKQLQPLKHPSAGSVFKNPAGQTAGRLIDEAGWKGITVGGAKVSQKHANFIINEANATAQDIFYLLRLIQADIYQTKGIKLIPEIRIYGKFDEPDELMYEKVKSKISSGTG